MYTFEVSNSDRKNKKLKIIIYKDGVKIKTLHVGSAKHYDYIKYYRDFPSIANERRLLYLSRHSKEDWNNFMKPAFWARWLLWEKKTLKEAIANIDLNR